MRWVGLLVLVATFALPAQTSFAAEDFRSVFLEGGSNGASFGTRGSNGYSIEVVASREGAVLTAAKESVDASYVVRAKLRGGKLVARIGNRGRIAVRFRQTEGFRKRMPPRRCEGKPRITRYGVFAGTIQFHGEHGYTTVERRAARGRLYSQPRWRCPRSGGKFKPSPPEDEAGESDVTTLEARTPDGRIAFGVLAGGADENGLVIFFAQMRERRKRMEVSRTAFVFDQAGEFEHDADLTSAEVRPPPPFQGTATFTRGPTKRALWRGSLAVTLPGAPRLRLAGTRFRAKLENSSFLRLPARPTA